MIFQWSMYYLAFAPLWICVLFMDVMSLIHGTQNPWTERISIILIPIAFLIALSVMKRHLKPDKRISQKNSLKSASEEKLLTAEFLATFIFPLFAFEFTTWEGMVIFAIFFFVFGWLCIRHNYFCTNIMLDVFGYRIYACDLVNSNDVQFEKKILSKRDLTLCTGTNIYAKGLNNDYSLDCFEDGDLEEDNEWPFVIR